MALHSHTPAQRKRIRKNTKSRSGTSHVPKRRTVRSRTRKR